MKIELELDEEMIQRDISKAIVTSNKYNNQYAIKKAIEEGVKELIYINKAEIIEKVIQRASAEMVRKGFKQFIDKLKDIDDKLGT